MQLRPLLVLCGAVLLCAGCATTTESSTSASESKMASSEETYVPVGSHIRTKRGKTKAVPTRTMSGEEYTQQVRTDQIYPSGEKILESRSGTR